MAGGTRKREMHVSSSWRMVEGGENDSFDTSVLRDDDDLVISSGSDPSQYSGSQPFSIGGSQPFSIGGSQDDNIDEYLSRAENDDQFIVRTPFRPSVPQSVRRISREVMRHRSPEPEFFMPTVEVESPRRDSNQSSRTVRPPPSLPGLRHRQVAGSATDSPTKGSRHRKEPRENPEQQQRSFDFGDRLSESLLGALWDVAAWLVGVIAHAFRFAQKPLGILLSIYLIFGGFIIVQNMATKSVYTSLSPICRIPGASYLQLPFCPVMMPRDRQSESATSQRPVESLMSAQSHFEQVLEKSAAGVSLPLEMKRSEAAVRDLRTLVRQSDIEGKEELVEDFNGFIQTARAASTNLQKFNTHVGSTVDSIISINRWTSRYLDGLAKEHNEKGLISEWASWIFSPFQPAVFSERNILDKYIEHTALVSAKIRDLLVEAQAVLRTLQETENHLETIYVFVALTEKTVQGKKDEILWTLWTYLGANKGSLRNLNEQLSLLRLVNTQRMDAVEQVSELITELGDIESKLANLRDRVVAAEAFRDVPLSVHIETINLGVDKLEVARRRIREAEDERIREVLERAKVVGEDKMIEPS